MRGPRPPRIFWIYAALSASAPFLFHAVGLLDHIRGSGLLLTGVLLYGLARRSRLAWWLLVILNGYPLILWLGLAPPINWRFWLFVSVFASLEATLLSKPMREHVFDGRRGRRLFAHT
jgi:hypothetical protein